MLTSDVGTIDYLQHFASVMFDVTLDIWHYTCFNFNLNLKNQFQIYFPLFCIIVKTYKKNFNDVLQK